MTDASSSSSHVPHDQTMHPLEAQRRANRDVAAGLGANPYGVRVDGLVSLAEAAARYDEGADAEQKARGKEPGFVDRRPVVRVAGRVMLLRDNGKLLWANLRDASGDLQVAISQRDCAEPGFAIAKSIDMGDIVVAEGPLTKTKTGEVTVWASRVEMGAKCLVPPPEKHAGLSDPELRYRMRYVDMWANPETTRVFQLRSRIVSLVRRVLDGMGYMEVETPMLQTLAGGAAARPFTTHMNALDISLFMRIAPELYLKRLLVGGLPRVYEINRNFRNEGLDARHNPEFTMLELYHAFGDMETVMGVTEGLIREAARAVAKEQGVAAEGGGFSLPFGEMMIEYGAPFARVRYGELFKRALGVEMGDRGGVARLAAEKKVKAKDEKGVALDHWLIVNNLFEEFAEPMVDPARPTFITHYPSAISPLTRPNREDPTVADRADLFIGGMEIAPHYTELNDPDVQAAKFREQLAGLDDEESTFRTFDEDFIMALKVGMPPAGGMGLGIDRLVMLLTNQRTIRDVVLFPLMRPLDAGASRE
ncbi:MAG: lysine--tRNA ligase [Phycisphaeraceae bacterium]|nr:lysine--tRNA ligase [Phycisphaeraceae bacterium]